VHGIRMCLFPLRVVSGDVCVDDHDVFAFLTHSLTASTDAVSGALHYQCLISLKQFVSSSASFCVNESGC